MLRVKRVEYRFDTGGGSQLSFVTMRATAANLTAPASDAPRIQDRRVLKEQASSPATKHHQHRTTPKSIIIETEQPITGSRCNSQNPLQVAIKEIAAESGLTTYIWKAKSHFPLLIFIMSSLIWLCSTSSSMS